MTQERIQNANDADALQSEHERDEPMTDAQASYLRTLCDDVGEEFDRNLTKAQASERIEELQSRRPRLHQEV